jgi:hypothetical protein
MPDSQFLPYATLVLLIISAFVLIISAFLLTVVLFVDCRRSKPRQGGGPFCAHCGKGLPKEPESAVALENLSLLSYVCRSCLKNTLLPTPDGDV